MSDNNLNENEQSRRSDYKYDNNYIRPLSSHGFTMCHTVSLPFSRSHGSFLIFHGFTNLKRIFSQKSRKHSGQSVVLTFLKSHILLIAVFLGLSLLLLRVIPGCSFVVTMIFIICIYYLYLFQ